MNNTEHKQQPTTVEGCQNVAVELAWTLSQVLPDGPSKFASVANRGYDARKHAVWEVQEGLGTRLSGVTADEHRALDVLIDERDQAAHAVEV